MKRHIITMNLMQQGKNEFNRFDGMFGNVFKKKK